LSDEDGQKRPSFSTIDASNELMSRVGLSRRVADGDCNVVFGSIDDVNDNVDVSWFAKKIPAVKRIIIISFYGTGVGMLVVLDV
jgi:hypothetical protein